MNRKQIAEWLHKVYEEEAEAVGWKTQDGTSVEFENLPEKNRETMLNVAERIKEELL